MFRLMCQKLFSVWLRPYPLGLQDGVLNIVFPLFFLVLKPFQLFPIVIVFQIFHYIAIKFQDHFLFFYVVLIIVSYTFESYFIPNQTEELSEVPSIISNLSTGR